MPQDARERGDDLEGFLCDPTADEFETVFCGEEIQLPDDVLGAHVGEVGGGCVFGHGELVNTVVGGVGAVVRADADLEEVWGFSYDCYATEHWLFVCGVGRLVWYGMVLYMGGGGGDWKREDIQLG